MQISLEIYRESCKLYRKFHSILENWSSASDTDLEVIEGKWQIQVLRWQKTPRKKMLLERKNLKCLMMITWLYSVTSHLYLKSMQFNLEMGIKGIKGIIKQLYLQQLLKKKQVLTKVCKDGTGTSCSHQKLQQLGLWWPVTKYQDPMSQIVISYF